ncbi:fimbrial protein [Pseudomonas putida CSV86]|uniref:Fimbrial protein n=1 Tax=Pseudomonas bharatica CSV86 TaxID=1005395 RepID=L1M505_9PSED|nr:MULTISPECIES: fimbrial protein [Pseudomonas]MDG9885528.1 fimbrial protein [Pseudomonas sp. GD04058]NNJ16460.1 fimbrial protein [Pseudomonas bharatica CSV86]
MKRTLLAAALLLAGTSAFATTGTINFNGKINGSTCPIEIVNPDSGAVGNLVQMGAPRVADFPNLGAEAGGRSFSMRVPGGAACGIDPDNPNTATVTFTGVQGGAGADGSLYAIKTVGGAATGVAVALKDRSGNPVKNGEASAAYPLNVTGATEMFFTAVYKSTAATVTPGAADADVSFVVKIN